MSVSAYRVRLARVALLLGSLAALGGCSLLRVGYNYFDTFAAWNAERYFDLDQHQRQEFIRRFERLHAWHRHQQLPDYAAFLGETKARFEKGLTPADVTWAIEGGKKRYRAIVVQMAGDSADMLASITPAQLEALQRQWDRDNQRFIREYRLDEGIEEQRRAQLARMVERIEDWTGSLSPEQESRVAALAREFPLIHGLRHQDRLRRQREFLDLLSRRKDSRRFAAELRDWLSNWEKGRDPEYHRLFNEWERRQADYYVAVDRMLTPEQRKSVTDRLQRFMDDFARLAERPQSAGR